MEMHFPKPDDMHVHLRDGDALRITVPATAKQFARAIVMPNLKKPITLTAQARDYRDRILAHVPESLTFDPLMTLYLNPSLPVSEISVAKQSGIVHGVKLYPQGATTHSDQGTREIKQVYPILQEMEKVGLPLLIHGEAVGHEIDIFDREKIFITETLIPLRLAFPELKIVLEHITTRDAVDFVTESPKQVAATLTAHHLMFNRNHMLAGGINPHLYCMPILKREPHRQALIQAATSGNPQFFLGTDSAPHEISTKLSSCGCAGVFSALSALECYAQVFEEAGKIDKLPAFASQFGADFYGLPYSTEKVHLVKEPNSIPEKIPYLDGELVPLCAGQTLSFKLKP